MAVHRINYDEVAKAAGEGASEAVVANLLSMTGLSNEDSLIAAGNIIKGDPPEQAVQTVVRMRKPAGGFSPTLMALFGVGVVAIFLFTKKGKGFGAPKSKKKRKKK